MSAKYSAEWVREQAHARSATFLDSHKCCFCGVMVGHIIDGENVWFKSACGCGSSAPRSSSFEEIARGLAMQSSDEIRERMMEGLR